MTITRVPEPEVGIETATDDLTWAKPCVDEALEAAERGEVMSLDEHRARNKERLAAIRDRSING